MNEVEYLAVGDDPGNPYGGDLVARHQGRDISPDAEFTMSGVSALTIFGHGARILGELIGAAVPAATERHREVAKAILPRRPGGR